MRGCSDLLWNVGRTALFRNRCHAVIELERRARKGSRDDALVRVAHRIQEARNVTPHAVVQGYFNAISGAPQVHSVDELATALGKCAHGIFTESEVSQTQTGLRWRCTMPTLRVVVCKGAGDENDHPECVRLLQRCAACARFEQGAGQHSAPKPMQQREQPFLA